MTWFSDEFFWIPATGPYDQSIHLYVDDGWKIKLDMDDCTGEAYNDCKCEHVCGYNDTALRELTLEQLKELHLATGKAIELVERSK